MKRFVLTVSTLLLASLPQPVSAKDPSCDLAAGKRVFGKCRACHSLDTGKHLQGPSLAAMFDRKAGTAEGFKYSTAMSAAEVIWDEGNFKAFVENPRAAIPGNTMPFGGIRNEKQRNDLYCFLREESE